MSRDPLHITAEALFRYQWVAEIQTRVLAGEPLSQAIRALRHHPRPDPQGRARKPSRRSLYRWYAAFRADGLAGLESVKRKSSPQPVMLNAKRMFCARQPLRRAESRYRDGGSLLGQPSADRRLGSRR